MSRVTPPVGIWLIAGTWAHTPYKCRCKREKACWTSVSNPDGHPGYWCPCWGRTDLDGLPAYCCAPGHPIHAKEAQPA